MQVVIYTNENELGKKFNQSSVHWPRNYNKEINI